MTLRPAILDDALDLARLHAASFDDPWTASEIVEVLAGPGGFGLVATAEGVCGFVLARALAGEAEILTLAVDPVLRRSGSGRLLTDGAAEAALTRGATVLFLEVAVDNAAAIALYAAAGFREAGRRRGYYRRPNGHTVDALVLRRDLTA